MAKIDIAESIDGDWVKLFLDGECVVSDHNINRHHFKDLLRKLGVEYVQHEDMEGDDLMEWRP